MAKTFEVESILNVVASFMPQPVPEKEDLIIAFVVFQIAKPYQKVKI